MAKNEKFEPWGLLENGALVGTYNSKREAEQAKRKAESEAFDIGDLYELEYTIVTHEGDILVMKLRIKELKNKDTQLKNDVIQLKKENVL